MPKVGLNSELGLFFPNRNFRLRLLIKSVKVISLSSTLILGIDRGTFEHVTLQSILSEGRPTLITRLYSPAFFDNDYFLSLRCEIQLHLTSSIYLIPYEQCFCTLSEYFSLIKYSGTSPTEYFAADDSCGWLLKLYDQNEENKSFDALEVSLDFVYHLFSIINYLRESNLSQYFYISNVFVTCLGKVKLFPGAEDNDVYIRTQGCEDQLVELSKDRMAFLMVFQEAKTTDEANLVKYSTNLRLAGLICVRLIFRDWSPFRVTDLRGDVIKGYEITDQDDWLVRCINDPFVNQNFIIRGISMAGSQNNPTLLKLLEFLATIFDPRFEPLGPDDPSRIKNQVDLLKLSSRNDQDNVKRFSRFLFQHYLTSLCRNQHNENEDDSLCSPCKVKKNDNDQNTLTDDPHSNEFLGPPHTSTEPFNFQATNPEEIGYLKDVTASLKNPVSFLDDTHDRVPNLDQDKTIGEGSNSYKDLPLIGQSEEHMYPNDSCTSNNVPPGEEPDKCGTCTGASCSLGNESAVHDQTSNQDPGADNLESGKPYSPEYLTFNEPEVGQEILVKDTSGESTSGSEDILEMTGMENWLPDMKSFISLLSPGASTYGCSSAKDFRDNIPPGATSTPYEHLRKSHRNLEDSKANDSFQFKSLGETIGSKDIIDTNEKDQREVVAGLENWVLDKEFFIRNDLGAKSSVCRLSSVKDFTNEIIAEGSDVSNQDPSYRGGKIDDSAENMEELDILESKYSSDMSVESRQNDLDGLENWLPDSGSFVRSDLAARSSGCGSSSAKEFLPTSSQNEGHRIPCHNSSFECPKSPKTEEKGLGNKDITYVTGESQQDEVAGLENWMPDSESFIGIDLSVKSLVCGGKDISGNITPEDLSTSYDSHDTSTQYSTFEGLDLKNSMQGYSLSLLEIEKGNTDWIENWMPDSYSLLGNESLVKRSSGGGLCSQGGEPLTESVADVEISIKEAKTIPDGYSIPEQWIHEKTTFFEAEDIKSTCGCSSEGNVVDSRLNEDKQKESFSNWIDSDLSSNQTERGSSCAKESLGGCDERESSTPSCPSQKAKSSPTSLTFIMPQKSDDDTDDAEELPIYRSESSGKYIEYLSKRSKEVHLLIDDPPKPIIKCDSSGFCDMTFQLHSNVEMVFSRIPNKFLRKDLEN